MSTKRSPIELAIQALRNTKQQIMEAELYMLKAGKLGTAQLLSDLRTQILTQVDDMLTSLEAKPEPVTPQQPE